MIHIDPREENNDKSHLVKEQRKHARDQEGLHNNTLCFSILTNPAGQLHLSHGLPSVHHQPC